MNASARSHVLTDANPVAKHGAKGCIDPASEDVYFDDRSHQRNSGQADVPGEAGFEIFADGDGI
jgi:hypothetical protein